ncbi:MAG: 1-acyl-sn-glycerol-3-phosphate acyltransferase [Rhizobiales bacterium]|nr:1-acyl-sn-glycerol-3-phosphate acyltransferase [Hyphomicrobiales bacterium]
MTWQRLAWRLIGMRVRVIGEPAPPPVLIAANHTSWLDITVLGGIVKPVSFIAKSEVAGWPVLGLLAKLQRTIFIDRTKRLDAGPVAREAGRRVGRGEAVVLFPEGTTGDGNRILAFKSALIGAAGLATGEQVAMVQPVAISYVGIHGLPVGSSDRPSIAWYGDMDFVSHFLRIVRRGGMDVVVAFGEPIAFGPGANRKQIAERCSAEVRRMVEAIRSGGPSPNLNAARVFSHPAKTAKGTRETPARSTGEAIEEVPSRAS